MSGYLVIAINFVDGTKGIYRARQEGRPPGTLMESIIRDDDTGGLAFLGKKLGDPASYEDCWFHVPPTGYTLASWQYYKEADLEALKKRPMQ